MSSAFLAALLLGLALAASPPSARAAVQDGNLSVLIITEKGTCGRRLPLQRERVERPGELSGRCGGQSDRHGRAVRPLVKVSIRVGDQGANGSGRLSARSGVGTWRGAGSWEAERR